MQLLPGEKVEGEFVQIYAAVGNTDDQGGRGQSIDCAYCWKKEDAQIYAATCGPMGSRGDVEPRWAFRSTDGTVFLLHFRGGLPPDVGHAPHFPVVSVAHPTDPGLVVLKKALREAALKKLTPLDRDILGTK